MTIRDRLNNPNQLAEIAKALPKHCSPERMARVALTAINRTPKLADCTQESFFECLLNLSQWGLEPDGRRAHFIPYGNKCTLIIDYKGYIELAYRSGKVKMIHADVVRTGDIFEYSLGRVTKHTPWFLRADEVKPKESGEVYAAYCYAELEGGTVKCEVLSKEEVDGIRKRSKAASSGPWVTDYCEMAKKTAFRRMSKWLPLSAEVLDAIDKDDEYHPLQQRNGSSGASVARSALNDQLATPTVIDAPSTPSEPDVIDEPQADLPPQGESTPDRWADVRAAFEECSTLEEVADKQHEFTTNCGSDADADRIRELAEVTRLRLKPKGKASQKTAFETAENVGR
jgi:recombination protein RecT